MGGNCGAGVDGEDSVTAPARAELSVPTAPLEMPLDAGLEPTSELLPPMESSQSRTPARDATRFRWRDPCRGATKRVARLIEKSRDRCIRLDANRYDTMWEAVHVAHDRGWRGNMRLLIRCMISGLYVAQ